MASSASNLALDDPAASDCRAFFVFFQRGCFFVLRFVLDVLSGNDVVLIARFAVLISRTVYGSFNFVGVRDWCLIVCFLFSFSIVLSNLITSSLRYSCPADLSEEKPEPSP